MDNKFMKVQCVAVNNKIFSFVKLGQIYYIDRESLYIDGDGKVYGMVYNEEMKQIGKMPHVHFKSVE